MTDRPIQPGDRLTLKQPEVIEDCPPVCPGLVRVRFPSGGEYSINPSDIASVTPRPLKVGDRVRVKQGSGRAWIVLDTHDDAMFLRASQSDDPFPYIVRRAGDLERIND